MTRPETNPEALRALVRQYVVAAIEQLENSGGQRPGGVEAQSAARSNGAAAAVQRRLLVLFLSRHEPGEEFFSQLADLARHGYGFVAAFSHSFLQFHPVESVASRLPKGTSLLLQPGEKQLLESVSACSALVASTLSVNTAAKLSAGVDDSLPTLLFTQALLSGKPVFVARELASLAAELDNLHAAVRPAFRRIALDHFHKARQLGIEYVRTAGLVQALVSQFTEQRNETPERLAKQRPALKREIITAEDLRQLLESGKRELVHSSGAIITDQARDYAIEKGLALRCEG